MRNPSVNLSAAAIGILALLVGSNSRTVAGPYAYESFSGMTLGSGLSGSGTNAYGWASDWIAGNDVHFQTDDPTPNLLYAVSGGAVIDGGDRAVQLTTNPEPLSSVQIASRTLGVGHNTTLYIGCLVRPMAVGTGSDTLSISFASNSTVLARVSLKPDLSQLFFTVELPLDSFGGSYGGTPITLYPGQTYFLVFRLTQPSTTRWKTEIWVNPPAVYPGLGPYSGQRDSLPASLLFNKISLHVFSTDTGGPTSAVLVDELRVGFVWADVVLPAPAGIVPDLTITSAVKLRWFSQAGKVYQPQFSYDLTTWFNLGVAISGNNSAKELFDATPSDARKFYQVRAQ